MIESFKPALGITNPHAQTMFANILRSKRGVHFRRERLNTPDGDFVDLDYAYVNHHRWLWTELGQETPLILVLHGLEGSARRGYGYELYRQLAQRGIRAVGLNFRSCSGEMNRTTRMYHSGATEDVDLVLNWLTERFPSAPLGIVGFSLGGSVTIKYMGENGTHVQTAVSVSPPFDLDAGVDILDHGVGRRYTGHFLKLLKEKVRAKSNHIPHHIDVEALLAAETFREFDNGWAPLHGFQDAADYYARCSPRNFLAEISKPTLILRSLDDPFFSPDDVPYDTITANPNLTVHLTEHGGHVGFVEGKFPWAYSYWAERQAALFINHQINNDICHQPLMV